MSTVVQAQTKDILFDLNGICYGISVADMDSHLNAYARAFLQGAPLDSFSEYLEERAIAPDALNQGIVEADYNANKLALNYIDLDQSAEMLIQQMKEEGIYKSNNVIAFPGAQNNIVPFKRKPTPEEVAVATSTDNQGYE